MAEVSRIERKFQCGRKDVKHAAEKRTDGGLDTFAFPAVKSSSQYVEDPGPDVSASVGRIYQLVQISQAT